jgi:hypothetical protein
LLLYFGQNFTQFDSGFGGDQHTNGAVELIYRAIGFHAWIILGCTATVAQSGGAVIAGACIDFAESIAHGLPVSVAQDGIGAWYIARKKTRWALTQGCGLLGRQKKPRWVTGVYGLLLLSRIRFLLLHQAVVDFYCCSKDIFIIIVVVYFFSSDP